MNGARFAREIAAVRTSSGRATEAALDDLYEAVDRWATLEAQAIPTTGLEPSMALQALEYQSLSLMQAVLVDAGQDSTLPSPARKEINNDAMCLSDGRYGVLRAIPDWYRKQQGWPTEPDIRAELDRNEEGGEPCPALYLEGAVHA